MILHTRAQMVKAFTQGLEPSTFWSVIQSHHHRCPTGVGSNSYISYTLHHVVKCLVNCPCHQNRINKNNIKKKSNKNRIFNKTIIKKIIYCTGIKIYIFYNKYKDVYINEDIWWNSMIFKRVDVPMCSKWSRGKSSFSMYYPQKRTVSTLLQTQMRIHYLITLQWQKIHEVSSE